MLSLGLSEEEDEYTRQRSLSVSVAMISSALRGRRDDVGIGKEARFGLHKLLMGFEDIIFSKPFLPRRRTRPSTCYRTVNSLRSEFSTIMIVWEEVSPYRAVSGGE